MSSKTVAPYGSWASPIGAHMLVQAAVGISEVVADPVRPGLLWWAESRPDQGGRTAVMCCELGGDGEPREVTLPDANVRTRVHEYGGGAWWPHDGALYYTEYADQRLRRLDPGASEPLMLTPEPSVAGGLRYADGRLTPDGRWAICVRERHEARHGAEPSHDRKAATGTAPSDERSEGEAVGHPEPVNELVAVATDGSLRVIELWSGSDFVMSPRVSPDGSLLAWISWDHPHMPWDNTRLHVAKLGDAGLGRKVLVVGQQGDRSLCEPGWVNGVPTRSGEAPVPARLLVCSDHEDWWRLYEVDLAHGGLTPVVAGDFDVATPPWVFGMQRWAATGHTVVAVAGLPTGDELIVDGQTVETGDSAISSLTLITGADDGREGSDGREIAVAYAGAGFDHETEVVVVTVPAGPGPSESSQGGNPHGAARRRVVRPARKLGLDPALLCRPEVITFETGPPAGEAISPHATSPGRTASGDPSPAGEPGTRPTSAQPDPQDASGASGPQAHALYYPPANPLFDGPPDELPPLMVLAHGGPTAAARRQLQLSILYWTSRGFGVVDVDYRGSTGYGRRYRQGLHGQWGVADVQDCVNAARHLAARGDADPQRLLIRGSSAGGFTVLAALAFHDAFAAGASRYGIADLEVLAADTHKFESRYLDTLVGPWPETRARYEARSPIHHLEGFGAPLIVLQGQQDEIVPPSQAEMIVAALETRGVDVAYVSFDNEQHGFRRAENIITALESELAFFAAVLGFSPADQLPEVQIRGN